MNKAAITMNNPPAITAAMRLLFSRWFITQPKNREAKISGITMKKLKIPMYTPAFCGGNDPASTA